jgi:hypothetical protein
VTRGNRQFVSIITFLSVLCCLALVVNAQAQDSTAQVQKTKDMEVKSFYVHGALGWALDVYSSSEINDIFLDQLEINTVGFPFQYGFRGGYRNIAQIEFCKYSTSAHNIGTGGLTIEGPVSVSVPMKLKATDVLFKINPFVWSWANRSDGRPDKCLFLILGSGSAEYRDDIGDGFEGSGMIYGLEWAGISKYLSLSLGATYQSITFDRTTIGKWTFPETQAGRFLMYVRMGLGYGL